MIFMFHSFLEPPWQDQDISQTTSSPSMATRPVQKLKGTWAIKALPLEHQTLRGSGSKKRKAGDGWPGPAWHRTWKPRQPGWRWRCRSQPVRPSTRSRAWKESKLAQAAFSLNRDAGAIVPCFCRNSMICSTVTCRNAGRKFG